MPDDPGTPDTTTPAQRGATVPPVPATPHAEPDPGYDSAGVPTFESIREKIENRYTTALGGAELDAETAEGQAVEEQYEKRQRAAAERLAQIRESMRTDE
jgi:phage shock protein A